MIAYRTSETKDFMDCEKKWYLKWVKGIKPTEITRANIAAAFGTAFHFGMELYWDDSIDNEEMVKQAEGIFLGQLSDIYDDPNLVDYYKDIDPYSISNLSRCLYEMQEHGMDIFEGYSMFKTEYMLKLGNTTCDLILQDPRGDLVIVDYKTSVLYSKEMRDKYIEEFSTSWQMKHYCTAASIEFKENIYKYKLILVVPNMKRDIVYVQDYTLPPGFQEDFLKNVEMVWLRMLQVQNRYNLPIEHYTHFTRYGKCPYYDLCVTHQNNEKLAIESGDYVWIQS